MGRGLTIYTPRTIYRPKRLQRHNEDTRRETARTVFLFHRQAFACLNVKIDNHAPASIRASTVNLQYTTAVPGNKQALFFSFGRLITYAYNTV